MADEQTSDSLNPIELATELTIAWLNNPNVRTTSEEVPNFLKSMHATINELSNAGNGASAQVEYTPAVPVRSSVKPDYIVSLIDGRKLKSLKRHLSTHGLTPAQYRERYGLKPDYPMVAPNYSAQRREVAQRLGLGRKGRGKPAAASAATAPTAQKTTSAPASKTAPAASAPKVAPVGAAKAANAPKTVASSKTPGAKSAAKPAAAKSAKSGAKPKAAAKPAHRAPARTKAAEAAPVKTKTKGAPAAKTSGAAKS